MSTLQLAGAAVFALAGLVLLVQGVRNDVTRYGVVSGGAALVAAAAYAGLYADVAGELHYVAWLALTAAVALQLWWLAEADAAWGGAMLVADALAVGAAYVAGVAAAPASRAPPDVAQPDLVPAGVAAMLLLAALAVLFTRVSAAAGDRHYEVAAHFSVLRNLAVVVLVGYAGAWLLAATVLGGDVLEGVYLAVDLVAAVAFGGLLQRTPALLRE
jgi:bacteriorhodopsin